MLTKIMMYASATCGQEQNGKKKNHVQFLPYCNMLHLNLNMLNVPGR